MNSCIGPNKNMPPSVAEISCPATTPVGTSVAISVVASDPDGDKIAYKITFGDGIESEWSELLPSGQAKIFHHTYDRKGNFGVYAIASDEHQKNSGWSEKTFIRVTVKESMWFMYYLASSGKSMGVKTAPAVRIGNEVKIPAKSDWTDRGVVLSQGSGWDKRLTGALSPCTVVKKSDTYLLYYIGADGDRSFDGGPRHRALGVAYSTDGINFTKYSGNPILTFLPHNGEEEGIFSAGAFLDTNNEIVLYYSALDNAGVPESVNSDGRLAVSSNGLDFSDQGEVLSHDDSGVWGYGDELFPVGTFREGNTWYLYYIAKGHGAYWDLALAWGPGRSNISNNTKKVLEADFYRVGACHPIHLSTSKIALFTHRGTLGNEVRTASVSSPWALSSPVVTYPTIFGCIAVYLDEASYGS